MTATAVLTREPRMPATYRETIEMARMLISTGFLPASIKTAEQAVAIIMTGRELGIAPMHSLRSIHVIQGKPTLSAELQLALFHRAGGRSQVKQSTDSNCTVWFKHPRGDEHLETFTLEDAKRAGLLSKDGWSKYPKAMCRARAIAFGLRIVAPEIVAGVYDPEEMGAEIDGEGEIVEAPKLLAAVAYDSNDQRGNPMTAPPRDKSKDATEEQLATITRLMDDPAVTDVQRQRIVDKLVGPIRQNVAKNIISYLETLISPPKDETPSDLNTPTIAFGKDMGARHEANAAKVGL